MRQAKLCANSESIGMTPSIEMKQPAHQAMFRGGGLSITAFGTIVGGHAILENGRWTHVRQAKLLTENR